MVQEVGEELQGVVRNVTTFGAFVDCSLGVDGLLHK
jgi:ribosomal protein S1